MPIRETFWNIPHWAEIQDLGIQIFVQMIKPMTTNLSRQCLD